jgi:hypothetical protein
MEANNVILHGSVEFRDAVMRLTQDGRSVFVRKAKTGAPTFSIIPTMDGVTAEDLFKAVWPLVTMEDFAMALVRSEVSGELPDVEVFQLEDPNAGIL